jgi:hypothetical protein
METIETKPNNDAELSDFIVITDRSIINLSRNPNERCKIRLNDFEKKPEEILDICNNFKLNLAVPVN